MGGAISSLPLEEQVALSKKLKEAYVKARYSKHYRISNEVLTWLGACVEELGRVVHAVCSERIAALVLAAKPTEK